VIEIIVLINDAARAIYGHVLLFLLASFLCRQLLCHIKPDIRDQMADVLKTSLPSSNIQHLTSDI
jgi:hypothetical protein